MQPRLTGVYTHSVYGQQQPTVKPPFLPRDGDGIGDSRMLVNPGAILKSLRKLHGLSLTDLAARTSYSRTYLGNIETGERVMTDAVAAACDAALGGDMLTGWLRLMKDEDDMLRRSLLTGGALAALLTVADGPAALAQAVSYDLRTATRTTDWDALAAAFTTRHLTNPGAEFGRELAAQLMIARHAIITAPPAAAREAARGGALLALVYGLWMADSGRIPTAHGLYTDAAVLADHSTDPGTRGLVRARAATRAPYEHRTYADSLTAAEQALALSPAGSPAALEAHAARVHLHALTGNLAAGRHEVAAMYRTADTIGTAHAQQRAAHFGCYLECRAGTLNDAQTAYAAAEPLLRPVPLWLADATIYYGRALIAGGAVGAGASTALDAVTTAPRGGTRILALGVADAVAAAGPVRTETLRELARHAAPGPYPWDEL